MLILNCAFSFKLKAQLEKMYSDVKIYIEACITRTNIDGDIVMLVTDDHRFFSVFAQSPNAENILLGQVETLLKDGRYSTDSATSSHSPLGVKLAGEIIPGM